MRLHCDAGTPWPSPKNIENNPMQSSRRSPRRFEPTLDTSGKSAARFHHPKIRSNDRGAQRPLFGVASGETPSPMIGRCIVTASIHRCDPIPRGYTVEDELPMGIEGSQQ
jgi:hypothetical protein